MYHTKENIGKFCWYVNEQICKNADGFSGLSIIDTDLIINLIENGSVDEAIELLEPYKDIKVKGLVNGHNYIKERKERMNYSELREEGYYVGSGPMKSANKYYIQNRMKGPGMAWAIECGQRMLLLRGYYIGDHWSDVIATLNDLRDDLIELKNRFEQEELARHLYDREMNTILDLLLG